MDIKGNVIISLANLCLFRNYCVSLRAKSDNNIKLNPLKRIADEVETERTTLTDLYTEAQPREVTEIEFQSFINLQNSVSVRML